MRRALVINVVGLTPNFVGPNTPHLKRLADAGGLRPLRTITPAVTCSVQATLTTGSFPRDHGIVGNGWYYRDLAEVAFWRQSNHLVTGESIWDAGRKRDAAFTCAKMFWWFNMYSSADWSVTPRPMYPADGRKIPDVYAQPAGLRDDLQRELGQFPLFEFWGPRAGINSTRWIARATLRVMQTQSPTLTLAYLPHLDYALQKVGPNHPDIAEHLRDVDEVCGELIEHASQQGLHVIVCSEYGITDVSGPIHINRALREAAHIAVREEMGRELLDAGASRAFAVADHQVAHVYVRELGRIPEVKALLEGLDGVERVLDSAGKRALGLDHDRAGELVAIAKPDRWFTYYHWLDDERAPDYARTVDIHRKPGYDPVELFIDPELSLPQLKVGWRLAQKAMGMRMLMDVIPLDATLVKGSHGRVTDDPQAGPLVISSEASLLPAQHVDAVRFKDLVLSHIFDT